MTDEIKKSSTPHDDFYRQSLSNTQVAQEFFACNLPQHVLAIIDLTTLAPAKDTFSDTVLGNAAADAIFTVKFCGTDGYLTLHAEHQSTSDHFMALRLKKYMILLWEQHRSKDSKSKYLPLIYPLIYYTGKAKYTAPLDFFDLFEQPELAKEFFIQPHQLIDLHRTPDQEIAKTVWLGVMLLVMKHAKSQNIILNLLYIKQMLIEIGKENYLYIEAIFKYLVNEADTNEIYRVIEIFKAVVPESDKEKIVTIAERLIQEGRQEGVQEGSLAKAITIVEKMLSKGVAIEEIAEFTELSIDRIHEIRQKSNSSIH